MIVATEIVTNSRPTLSEPVFLSVFTSPSYHLFQPLSFTKHPYISSICPHSLASFFPAFTLPPFLPSIHPSSLCLCTFLYTLHPTPQNVLGLAVYQASTLSSPLWLMLFQCNLSAQCHHSAFKIQSFSETAVVSHLSSPPFWLWLRGTIGSAHWCPA